MKSFKSIIALAMCAVAIVGCKPKNEPSVPTQQEIETKIIGKWKSITENEETMITNRRFVETYNAGGNGFTSSCNEHPVTKELGWINKQAFTYTISGSYVTVKDSIEEMPDGGPMGDTSMPAPQMEKKQQILSIDNNCLLASRLDGEVQLNMKKVSADYTNDIIGTWEGIAMTGYETYGNAEARIEYRADGTYTYYVKDGDNWVASKNVDNEYNVDGDWLATRWRPEAGADYNYEWWDIDEIKDDTMKWSALREKEDSTRFTTTFTWKKVN